jgi:hypothetical protein
MCHPAGAPREWRRVCGHQPVRYRSGAKEDTGSKRRRRIMFAEKRTLSIEELEAQTALELPNRELMLVTVVITNLLNGLSVNVEVKNNNVAVQVCAVVQALNTILVPTVLECDIQQ